MALKIKKGDLVQIIAGDHKGLTGRVLRVDPRRSVVYVQGQNLAKKHVRPSRKYPQGGRINIEQPLHISNVLPVHPKTNRATRVKFAIGPDGSKKRLATDGTELGVVARARR
ncbi:MAG: 50S ribosomal protein L24 [Sedimentisphaerales bacterium]|jgi:large subunit ribosomal protein L24|nr:50S ribosomal protein L24 [Sedimentisphaerales bacterium]